MDAGHAAAGQRMSWVVRSPCRQRVCSDDDDDGGLPCPETGAQRHPSTVSIAKAEVQKTANRRAHSDSKTFPDRSRRSDLVPVPLRTASRAEKNADGQQRATSFDNRALGSPRRAGRSKRLNRTRVNPTVPFSVTWPVRTLSAPAHRHSTVSTTPTPTQRRRAFVSDVVAHDEPRPYFLFFFRILRPNPPRLRSPSISFIRRRRSVYKKIAEMNE